MSPRYDASSTWSRNGRKDKGQGQVQDKDKDEVGGRCFGSPTTEDTGRWTEACRLDGNFSRAAVKISVQVQI